MFDTLVVMGVGLIGGSIAAAARKRNVSRRIVGLGRSAARLKGAIDSNLLDEAVDAPEAIDTADLVVVCTPVNRIAEDVRKLAAVLPKTCLLTDAGSVKGPICDALSSPDGMVLNFVGGHPLAGSEKAGWEYADADLFQGKLCVTTPVGHEPTSAVGRVEAFWRGLGMQVRRMSPHDHDVALALTSHLPHLAASALAAQLTAEMRPFAARGFRDTTRIAAGDPDLWTAILSSNAAAVVDHLAAFSQTLDRYANALRSNDTAALRSLLAVGQEARDAIE